MVRRTDQEMIAAGRLICQLTIPRGGGMPGLVGPPREVPARVIQKTEGMEVKHGQEPLLCVFCLFVLWKGMGKAG